jgi:tetratricopeptide (TPR) repeat protein
VQIDRRSQARLNAVMGGVLIAALGGLAWFVLSKPKPDRILVPPAIDLQGQDALRKGLQAERDGNYPEAEKRYREALDVKPGRSDLQLDLARSLALQGKQKEAWNLYRGVIQAPWIKSRQREADDALAWYADLCFKLGHPADGDRLVALIIPRTYRSPLPHSRALALAHLFGAHAASQLHLSGLGHVSRAAELDPSWSFVGLALCKIDLEAGRKEKAERQYAAIRRTAQSGSWEDWLLLARYDRDYGRAAKSLGDLQEARRRMGRYDTDAWLSYYHFDRTQPGSRQKTALLQKIDVSVRPDNPESLLSLAKFNFFYMKNRPSKPLAEAALRLTSPKESNRYTRIALFMNYLGDSDRAIPMLERTLPFAKETDRPWVEKELSVLRMPKAQLYGGGAGGFFKGIGGRETVIAFRDWLYRELANFH